jgi:hypothetical protein
MVSFIAGTALDHESAMNPATRMNALMSPTTEQNNVLISIMTTLIFKDFLRTSLGCPSITEVRESGRNFLQSALFSLTSFFITFYLYLIDFPDN